MRYIALCDVLFGKVLLCRCQRGEYGVSVITCAAMTPLELFL
jgi:hypothetical protein